MPFEDDLQRHADQVKARLPHIHGEEATKHSLVIPLFQVLGYDVYDPREVQPEFGADFAKKKPAGQLTKVDYAIKINGEPAIFVECKAADLDLDNHDAQLAYYFNSNPSVRVAILTNGVRLKVFTDLQQPNVMDPQPWMDFDLRNAKQAEIDALKRFRKSDFAPEQIVGLAEEMTYYSVLVNYFSTQLREPDEKFIRFVAKEIPTVGTVTARVVERIGPILRKAIHSSIVDHVARSFGGEAPPLVAVPATPAHPAQLQVAAAGGEPVEQRDGVVTTAEELQCFTMVAEMIREVHPDATVSYRDAKNYFTILQKNIRKWFMRLGVERTPYWVALRHVRAEDARRLCPGFEVADGGSLGDCRFALKALSDLPKLRTVILASYDAELARVAEVDAPETSEPTIN